MVPEDLRYTPEHEWVRMEGDRARVGITKFAADRLTDIVYVELPEVGRTVRFMEPFGVIESVKAASDLYSPLTGRVVAVNERLRDAPELVSQDPYGEGWMILIEPADLSELERLLDAEAYRRHIGES
ncbi:MAG: glycine cleavage system protein GcvH [Armatimonadota bacterium]|nr:glycine cleavage system protein GcvH [Armatimonadota bacterium]MDR7440181.1 glycine cleavage system protein GcvH [Armatimonadota bacterium]MDR7563631.1 glycine cleavage system protein GcvH [Armatimonadota bacterium]MDR7567327.1 glycine cleavage system protein GcvH [Armatimonadota bacterium]MDR7602519.1 glycine cleavage system protein GcvH [Armatimonadota bacterium]